MAFALGILVFVFGLLLFARRLPRGARLAVLAIGLGAPVAIAIPALTEDPSPRDLSTTSYSSSERCFRCHPGHMASWAASFHRTMTRPATPEWVKGDFQDRTEVFYGVPSRMTREGAISFMETIDPEWLRETVRAGRDPLLAPDRKLRKFRIDLAIGSHNYQQYASRLESGAVIRMPLAWHIGEARWIHMNGAFLQPESTQFYDRATLWNINCVFCHNVKAQPRIDPAAASNFDPDNLADLPFDTRVEELGIACEACHGPGEQHEAAHANPMRRWLRAASGDADPTIVNPARLDKQRSAEVCGHCHSLRIPQPAVAAEFFLAQDPYTAGEELGRYFHVQRADDWREGSGHEPGNNYWPDGTMKRTSIEFGGLLTSPCYERGEMTCLSCHTMHGKEPAGQLAPGMDTNQACTGCHASFADAAALESHTHHDAASSGSLCYNCHMPNVVWGLLRGMRSHRIISPTADTSVATGLPLACNQCHLDRTLAWSSEWLASWYGQAQPALDRDHTDTAASLVHLLRGDAAQRALAAWSFGWSPARAIAEPFWAPRYLVLTLADSYPAVRQAAFRSLRRYPGFADAEFDYLGEPSLRARQQATLGQRLSLAGSAGEVGSRDPFAPAFAGGPPGIPGEARSLDLLSRQDSTEVFISE